MRNQFLTLITLCMITLGGVQAQSVADGAKFLERGINDKAIETLRNITNKDSKNAQAFYYLGLTYLNMEKMDSAKYNFGLGVSAASTDGYSNICSVWLEMMAGNKAAALTYNQKALEQTKSKNGKVMMESARAFFSLKTKDNDFAIAQITKASQIDAKSAEIQVALGDAYLSKNAGSEASGAYKAALNIDPKSALATYKEGMLYQRARSVSVAKDRFLKAIEFDPQFASAYAELGDIALKDQKLEEGTSYYKKYVGMVGNDVNARIKYAAYLFIKKDYSTVITEIETIRKRDASNPALLRLLGYAQYEMGESVKAQATLEDYFMKIDNDKILASDYDYLAKAYDKNGSDLKSIEFYQKVVDKDTNRIDVYDAMVAKARKMKNYPLAANIVRKKLINSKSPTADNLTLGILLYNSKNYAGADSAFIKTTQLNNTLISPYLWRARVQAAQDDNSKKGLAKPFYEEYLTKVNNDLTNYKDEIIEAYSYLSFYYYQKKDEVNAKKYVAEVLKIDAKNSQAINLNDYYKKKAAAAAQQGAKKK